MPKFVIGKTPDQLDREKAERLRQQEAEIRESENDRNIQLRQLANKRRRNRIIVGVVGILLILALLVFGTYNTFFKHQMNEQDVANIIQRSVVVFPDTALDGFIRSNFNKWFNDMVSFEKQQHTKGAIKSVEANLDSLTIDEVKTVNSQLVRVYFSLDITTTMENYNDEAGKEVKGDVLTNRTSFFIPIQYSPRYTEIDGKQVVYGYGYDAVSPLAYNMIKTEDSENITQTDLLKFTEENGRYDELTEAAAKNKVEKILTDLYNGVYLPEDYTYNRKFDNSIGAQFVSVVDFKMYKYPNALGYNSHITYIIRTKEGFNVQTSSYLLLKQNGTSWTLAAII